MTAVLWLLVLQGLIGAFDTIYFHEWRARLPGLGSRSAPELRLHAVRSIIYSVLFGTLPWIQWRGAFAWLLAALLAAEIAITFADFVVEERVRAPLGGVFLGERLTHVAMAIIYGAMLARLVPILLTWSRLRTGLETVPAAGTGLAVLMGLMAAGVLASGVRDGLCALGVRAAAWPWTVR